MKNRENDAQLAVELAIEEINSLGGVGGHASDRELDVLAVDLGAALELAAVAGLALGVLVAGLVIYSAAKAKPPVGTKEGRAFDPQGFVRSRLAAKAVANG